MRRRAHKYCCDGLCNALFSQLNSYTGTLCLNYRDSQESLGQGTTRRYLLVTYEHVNPNFCATTHNYYASISRSRGIRVFLAEPLIFCPSEQPSYLSKRESCASAQKPDVEFFNSIVGEAVSFYLSLHIKVAVL